jgi:RNA polymerase sigma-70 factor, ECF subfamily
MNGTRTDGRGDAELLGAVADGDGEAMRVLYERHAPWLVLRLSRRCGDPAMVDEVVQDTFLAVWRRPRAWHGSGEVAAWLWGIAVRRLLDRLRRRPVPLLGLLEGGGRAEPSAEDQVLVGIEHGDLNRLSPELRSVLQATALDGLTTREAAKLLGIPAGTVKTRLLRARAQLREELA